jgi:acyl-CoA dehydrogenase
MDFTLNERETYWRDRVKNHIDQYVRPRVKEMAEELNQGDRWIVIKAVEEEKARAKAAGLWNLFMPPSSGHKHVDDTVEFEGPGLTNLEYALCVRDFQLLGT